MTKLAVVSESCRSLRVVVHFCYSLGTMSTLCHLGNYFFEMHFFYCYIYACTLFACCVGRKHTHCLLTNAEVTLVTFRS